MRIKPDMFPARITPDVIIAHTDEFGVDGGGEPGLGFEGAAGHGLGWFSVRCRWEKAGSRVGDGWIDVGGPYDNHKGGSFGDGA